MPTRSPGAARHLRTLFNLGVIRDLTDGQLLERFATRDGEAAELAFAALVERHGPMVLRACRSVLRDPNDAEDAFQATFVVLSRRAGGLWVRETIGPWLFSVALRVARRARSNALRRARHERRSAELAVAVRDDRPGLDPELESALHEELGRLAPRWREPIVLCDLQGRTYDEAARQLGLPVGTLKSRLARGRSRLGDRLRRRGLAPTLGLMGATSVPPSLLDATSSVAVCAATASLSAEIVPVAVFSLAHGVLRIMLVHALAKHVFATFAVVLTTGLALAAVDGAGQDDPPVRTPAPAVSGPVQQPIADPPALPGDDEPRITYEITFLELPGLGLHEHGFDSDYGAQGTPGAFAFLSDLEAHLVFETAAKTPGASVFRTTKLMSKTKGFASTSISHDQFVVGVSGNLYTSSDGKTFYTSSDGKTFTHLAPSTSKSGRAVTAGAPFPDPAHGEDEDVTIENQSFDLWGEITEDEWHVAIDFDIRDTHIVQVHRTTIPGPGPGASDREVEIPEVVRAIFDRRVTIPDGGIVLIDLGLFRTVDDAGESSIAQHLVMVKADLVPDAGRSRSGRLRPRPLAGRARRRYPGPGSRGHRRSAAAGTIPFSFFIGDLLLNRARPRSGHACPARSGAPTLDGDPPHGRGGRRMATGPRRPAARGGPAVPPLEQGDRLTGRVRAALRGDAGPEEGRVDRRGRLPGPPRQAEGARRAARRDGGLAGRLHGGDADGPRGQRRDRPARLGQRGPARRPADDPTRARRPGPDRRARGSSRAPRNWSPRSRPATSASTCTGSSTSTAARGSGNT